MKIEAFFTQKSENALRLLYSFHRGNYISEVKKIHLQNTWIKWTQMIAHQTEKVQRELFKFQNTNSVKGYNKSKFTEAEFQPTGLWRNSLRLPCK